MENELDKIVLEQCLWMEKNGIGFKLTDSCLIVDTFALNSDEKDKLMEFEERKRPFIIK